MCIYQLTEKGEKISGKHELYLSVDLELHVCRNNDSPIIANNATEIEALIRLGLIEEIK